MSSLLAQSVQIGDHTIEGPSQNAGGLFDLSRATIGDIVGASLGLVFAAAGIGLLLMIISSGFTLMTSAGDAKKLAQGRTTLTNSLIGFTLIFSAFWIVQILWTALGWENTFTIFPQ